MVVSTDAEESASHIVEVVVFAVCTFEFVMIEEVVHKVAVIFKSIVK